MEHLIMKRTVPSQKPKGLGDTSAETICDHKDGISETAAGELKVSITTRHLVELLTEDDINFIEERR